MKTRIAKWGDSLAVRIPEALARELRFREGSPVTIRAKEEELVVESAPDDEPFDLDELVSRITDENQHESVDFGGPAGEETW
ncbi:MAG: AbrB/MazE/SpoVT family DNA-binding domain-containing protein [Bacteroidetes bacterium QS_8_64_10]|jgi:antitoxin MazE|nr:MAG: AbrB/MazE/SpoVT family DNA-binding domain-containing protein [Bacteroidetes bacterium QS_8_64_10]